MTKLTVNQIVTERLLESMENGSVPWHSGVSPLGVARSWVTGKEYKGINRWLLPEGEYITYNQAKKNGGYVKKGSKSHYAMFYQSKKVPLKDKNGNDMVDSEGKKITEMRFIARYFTLFNVEDCEGIERKFPISEIEERKKQLALEGKEKLDNFHKSYTEMPTMYNRSGIKSPHYIPSTDEIYVYPKEYYKKAEDYFATLFHEVVHSTGHEKRLKREGIAKINTNDIPKYSFEELVAEMGASMLCGHFGILDTIVDTSAEYISSWKRNLKEMPNAFVQASKKADEAVEYILNHISDVEIIKEINEKSFVTIINGITQKVVKSSKYLSGNILNIYLEKEQLHLKYLDYKTILGDENIELSKDVIKEVSEKYYNELKKLDDEQTKLGFSLNQEFPPNFAPTIYSLSSYDGVKESLLNHKSSNSIEDMMILFKMHCQEYYKQLKEEQENKRKSKKEIQVKLTEQDMKRSNRIKEWFEVHKDSKQPMEIKMGTTPDKLNSFIVKYNREGMKPIYLNISPRMYLYSEGNEWKPLLTIPNGVSSVIQMYEYKLTPYLVKMKVSKKEIRYFYQIISVVFDLRKKIKQTEITMN